MNRCFVLAALAFSLLYFSSPLPGQDKLVYRTALVEHGNLKATVHATGTLQPEEVIEVGAQVAGTIVKFGPDPRDAKKTVDFGTPVEAGAVLAQLDPTLYQVRVERAKGRVVRAEAESSLADLQSRQTEATWNRLEKAGRGAVAADELARAHYEFDLARGQCDIQRAAIKEAQAALQEAELNLSLTTIRSPIKGVLLERRMDLGQTVAPALGKPTLFVIARDLQKMQVLAHVHEADIALVKPGQAATFTVAAYPKEVFKATVASVRLNANANKNVVTYTVVLNVENTGKLLPYLTATVRLSTAEKKNVLLVPNAALNWLPEVSQVAPSVRGRFYELESLRNGSRVQRVVWIADKGFVRPVVIHVGLSDGQATEVVEGSLKEGAAVVVGN